MPDDERLQCPNCGARVSVAGRDSLFCNYCGTKLRVRASPSGYLLVVADGFADDTALLAARFTLAQLEEDLRALGRYRGQVQAAWRSRQARFRPQARAPLMLLPVAFIFCALAMFLHLITNYLWRDQGALLLALLGVLCLIVGLAVRARVARRSREQARQSRQAEQEYQAQLARLDLEEKVIQRKLALLKAEIARASGN